ncbi:MAG TPA: hypothetical protein VHX36_08300 [Candidatus Acidoferrales bacterium]|jgi:hypothetical protein|nr:hypothetical protein [Candidatus Acidoferrales bacterium]
MGMKPLRLKKAPTMTLVVGAFLLVGIPACAQSSAQTNTATSAQTNVAAQANTPDRDNDARQRDVARFDQFLDSHPEVAQQLRQNPSLVDDRDFVNSHPALQDYLRDNPGVRDEIRQNPDAFMQREQRFDNHENDRDRDAMAKFDRFLDSHPEIAEQVRKNPSLVDDRGFVQNHPALQDYLRDNPGARDQLRQNPDAFLQQPQRSGDHDADNHDNDRDRGTRNLADFARFMDSHREVAEQLRRNPSLADNSQFVQNHPDLQDYLRDNPGVRDQLRQDPNAFVQREEQFNRVQNVQDRDNRQDLYQFDRFLDSHREIAEQVRRNPSLMDNRDFVQNHPALQDYLRDNPGVRDEVRQDPNAFMHQEDRLASNQRWDNHGGSNQHMASFHEFLESHHDIRADVTKDPTVVKNREYVQNHPELDGYLNAHPGVRDDMMADPNGFVRGTQQFKAGAAAGTGTSTNGNGSGMSTGSSTGTSTGMHGSTGVSTGTSTGTSTDNPKPKL